jgi:hypothetical protein
LPGHFDMTSPRIALILGLFAVSSASAQAETRSAVSCWFHPAPAPACPGFLITEASAEFRLNRRENETSPRFVLGVGFLKNVDSARSVGGVLAWDVGRGWAKPTRGELRYRRWLTTTAIDFSVGITHRGLIPPSGNGELGRAYGPTAGIGVEWKYVALDARGELLHGADQTRADIFLGGRTTSVGAPIAVLAGLGLIVYVVTRAGY